MRANFGPRRRKKFFILYFQLVMKKHAPTGSLTLLANKEFQLTIWVPIMTKIVSGDTLRQPGNDAFRHTEASSNPAKLLTQPTISDVGG